MKHNILKSVTKDFYQKKYRNRSEYLLIIDKKQVEEFDRVHKLEKDYLLKGRKWALIDDKYYEIPKAPRWTWFRNLKTSAQVITSVLIGGIVASAVTFPILSVTIWKDKFIKVNKEVQKYIDLEIEEEIVVGKSCEAGIVIKKSAKGEKQLPKTLKAVYTGGVKLDKYNPELSVSNYNNAEPENYYTYTYTKDKGILFIKKVLGPISIEMSVEERTYNVTFDKLNGSTQDIVEVKHNTKVNKPVDPRHPLCDFKHWSLKDSNEEFNFNTLINKDITLEAHWETNNTGVIVRGINGLAESYPTMADAYTAGNNIMKNINPDLVKGICSKEKYLETFNDVTVDENGYYNANITWELYTTNSNPLAISSSSDHYLLSFGRNTNSFGSGDDNLFISKINICGSRENKPKVVFDGNSPLYRLYDNKDSNKNIPCEYKFMNIDFDDNNISQGGVLHEGSNKNMDYKLTYDGCNFKRWGTYVQSTEYTYNIDVTINNCQFIAGSTSYAFAFDFESPDSTKTTPCTLKFTNNTIKGYKRGINLNCNHFTNVLVEGNTFEDLNVNSVTELDNSALQLSNGNGTIFNINNNTFKNCKGNCFKIHSTFTTGLVNKTTININNNNISKCGYVGSNYPGNDKELIEIKSSSNNISETETNKCGYKNNSGHFEQTEPNNILHLN